MRKIILALVAATLTAAAAEAPPGWTPELFKNASTIQFYTADETGKGHWSTVWVVVIDGAPYIRLGRRAASRIDGNANAPFVNIKVGNNEFDHVLAQPALEMADKVASAMADKYTMDLFVRFMDHPLTMRLVPAPVAIPHGG